MASEGAEKKPCAPFASVGFLSPVRLINIHARALKKQARVADKDCKGTDRHTVQRGCKDKRYTSPETLHETCKENRHAVQRAAGRKEKTFLQSLLPLLWRRSEAQAEERKNSHCMSRVQAHCAAGL